MKKSLEKEYVTFRTISIEKELLNELQDFELELMHKCHRKFRRSDFIKLMFMFAKKNKKDFFKSIPVEEPHGNTLRNEFKRNAASKA
jgi:hypothetical protein